MSKFTLTNKRSLDVIKFLSYNAGKSILMNKKVCGWNGAEYNQCVPMCTKSYEWKDKVITRHDTYRYERRRYDYWRNDTGSDCKNTNIHNIHIVLFIIYDHSEDKHNRGMLTLVTFYKHSSNKVHTKN